MELRQFVAQTVTQILEGVSEAKKLAAGKGGSVSPKAARYPFAQQTEMLKSGMLFTRSGEVVHIVDFDVAVTVVEQSGKEGKAGISIGSVVNLGGGGEQSTSSTSANRLKFRVPICYESDSSPQ